MPNQINEDELQKAIDDITNSAQGNADAGEMPAEASAGVAAPEAVPTPEAAGVASPEAPAPEAAAMPDFGVPPVPPVPPAPGAFDPSTVTPLGGTAPAPEAPSVPPMPAPEMPPIGEAPAPVSADEVPMIAPAEGTPEAVAAPVAGEMSTPEMPVAMSSEAPAAAPEVSEVDAGTSQIKADILRDLSPLMDKVQIEPEKKFHIYKDMMMTNNDKTVIPSAYETAKLIDDEQKRGEALVSLIDAIDS